MAKTPLTKDTQFVVGEEKVLVFVIALLFFALFLYGAIEAFLQGLKNLDYSNLLFVLALIPAIYLFKKGRSNIVYIRINKTGIYQHEQLLTTWPNFLTAYIAQKKKVISIQDNFILVVEYTKPGIDKGFRKKIPLTNTQNKSEEEVMEAIKFFWLSHKTS